MPDEPPILTAAPPRQAWKLLPVLLKMRMRELLL